MINKLANNSILQEGLWGLDMCFMKSGKYAWTMQSVDYSKLQEIAETNTSSPNPTTGEDYIFPDTPYLITERRSNPTSDWQ